MATALRCVGTNACSGIMEEVRVAFKGAALVATEDATLEEDYNKDDDDESIDIEYTDDDEEENEPNEYDDTNDIEEEETKDDEDEEKEYNFDDETDSDEVNLTPPEEKPNINKIEVVSLLTPPEENQTIVESAEIQASTEEVNAANALFSMSKNPKDIIFQFEDSGIGVERAKFESFYYEQWIFSNIIDPASMTNEDLSKDQRFENFEESVHLATCLVDEYVANLLNVDLYHKIEIIDNRLSDTEADEGSKISEIDLISKLYGKLPFVLKNLFCDYLKKKNHPKFHIMRFCKPNILKMAWRTRKNESDCGIFVMRHMETYNGQKVEEWNSGFRNEGEGQKGQLKTLRRKYAAKILLSDENLHRKKIISESIEFFSLPAEDKKHRLKQKTENFIKLRLQSSWNTKGKQLKKPLQSSVIKDRRSVDTIKEYKKVLLKKVDDEKGFIRKTKNNLFVLENLISEMNNSLKKGLSNYPNSIEVEGLIDEWDRVINAAKRAKLNQEYSILKSSRSESVFKENEENVKKKLNLNQEQRGFDSMPSFDLGFDLPSKQVAEITLCESLENVNLTPPEEKPNIDKIEVVSLLTPTEENQTIVESAEIQASTEEVNAANALFSMSKNPKDIIFQFEDSGIGVERAKFESFYYEQWIFSDIIDVWCILLNHKEFRRSNSGQSKLFCYTQVTPASMTNEDLSKDQRFENFEESDYLAACLVDEYVANLLNVDLVFFNILRDSHYYIICFNLKYHKIEIIDNRLSDTEADEGSKISEIDLISKLYGKLPFVPISIHV
ncbi:ulp1 protease family, C-terminal catalytic domain-containing protein [Artemisia annua]|uniref:Ulp1 protease family, C-terminal catalytic domain-containing protein n=1 Tax=Artemisia annua TaxID=35608 RepID=A0A2U1M6W6_ARTAN|nr:ulp1 protease family, C-terminal catalytic domain-containing protein [Artemisia annua]